MRLLKSAGRQSVHRDCWFCPAVWEHGLGGGGQEGVPTRRKCRPQDWELRVECQATAAAAPMCV